MHNGSRTKFVTYRAIAAKDALKVSVVDVEQKHATRRHGGLRFWERGGERGRASVGLMD